MHPIEAFRLERNVLREKQLKQHIKKAMKIKVKRHEKKKKTLRDVVFKQKKPNKKSRALKIWEFFGLKRVSRVYKDQNPKSRKSHKETVKRSTAHSFVKRLLVTQICNLYVDMRMNNELFFSNRF